MFTGKIGIFKRYYSGSQAHTGTCQKLMLQLKNGNAPIGVMLQLKKRRILTILMHFQAIFPTFFHLLGEVSLIKKLVFFSPLNQRIQFFKAKKFKFFSDGEGL